MLHAAWMALALTVSFAPQREGSPHLDPAREARVQKLGEEIRCATCQGLSISASPAPMARAQLDTVRAMVAEGKTDAEIYDYFTARFGEWVLLRPKVAPHTYGLWFGPGVLLIVGFLIILAQVRRRVPVPAAAGAPAAPSEDDYLKAVRSELER
jgi:cytochrome c-type biogenesis protein CcmH